MYNNLFLSKQNILSRLKGTFGVLKKEELYEEQPTAETGRLQNTERDKGVFLIKFIDLKRGQYPGDQRKSGKGTNPKAKLRVQTTLQGLSRGSSQKVTLLEGSQATDKTIWHRREGTRS